MREDAVGTPMTPQEINEAVARKLGVGNMDSIVINGKLIRCPLDYCNSIAAAWEIVDHIKSLAVRFDVELSCGQSRCQIDTLDEISVIGRADTAPMAICLAFLKLK